MVIKPLQHPARQKFGSLAMFTCPHCQFENPTQNRFCQHCGNPLKGLRAIVTCSMDSTLEPGEFDTVHRSGSTASTPETPDKAAAPRPIPLADLLTANTYLDRDKRYQLRQPMTSLPPTFQELELAILDSSPSKASPVMVMAEAAAAHPDALCLEDHLPPLAYPYWQLQDQYFPVIPELQAAWKTHSYTILIIEDRSTWQPLSEAWRSAAVDPMELVHWFYEMLELWNSLARFQAEPSLLKLQNLLIDDDQILCVQRLFYRPRDRACPISELGSLWQSLLHANPDSSLLALEDLALHVRSGQITSVSAIKEQLVQVADMIQAEATIPPVLDEEPHPNADLELPPTAPPDVSLTDEVHHPLPLEDEALLEASDPTDELSPTAAYAEYISEADEPTDPAAGTLDRHIAEDKIEDSINDLPTMSLPMKLYRLDEAGRTHVGRQRLHNEDSFYAETDLGKVDSPTGSTVTAKGLYILCDGMGGHDGGEVASALAVQTLRDYFNQHWTSGLPDEPMIKAGILAANQVIYEKNQAEERTDHDRMGTTLVMVLLADNQAMVAHVGDSRLYCFTRQGLEQATVDHEVGQREISRGVEPAIAYARKDAYQLTQALGPRSNDEVLPNISPLPLHQDTLLLLCSDGLSDNNLIETHTATHIAPMLRSRYDLDEGTADLIDLANEHNGHDNITVVAVRIKVRPNLDGAKGVF